MISEERERTQSGQVVLITGSTGFIGSALIKRLGEQYTLVGLDRPGPPDPPAPAVAVDFDLGSDEGVRQALDVVRGRFGSKIASVIHLAAYYDVSGEPNPLYDAVTVQGTRRLIQALQDFEVEQFIFASSMLVHRPTGGPDETISEDSPLGPTWAYPESKAQAEALLSQDRGEIPIVRLRIAGVYDDFGHSAFLAQQIARIYERQLTSHLYPGMLCAGQSFLHIDDLAEAFARLIERRRQFPQDLPLLVGEPEALGYDEIQDIVGCALHGEAWTTLRIPKPLAKAGAWVQDEALGGDPFVKPWMVDASNDHYILDISRAQRVLDWSPQHRLRSALPKIAESLKRDPRAWYKGNDLNPSVVAWYGQRPASAEDQDAAKADDSPGADAAMAHDEGNGADDGSGAHDGGMHEMALGHDDATVMALMEHDARRARWAFFTNIALGLWLAASPLVYDAMSTANVSESVRAVTADRGLPSVEWRAGVLAASDVISGLLIVFFGALSFSRRTAFVGQWGATAVGLWLLFAPILFWSPSGAQYLNDMVVGTLVITFSVLVPMMPGMSMVGMMDPKVVPPGWTYCPSTWAQRLPMAFLALIGLLIARMLTAYQMGHVDSAWEPFFAGNPADPRNGTEEIITSDVSKAWPVPDAGLGAVAYVLEILMAVMGTRDRWRTMPWMVTFFGILVIPLGVISIYFIIIQPIVIGTWSTPALIAALAMLVMIPFAVDEVIAMGQFVVWARRRGKPLIRTFLQGDAVEGGKTDRSDALTSPSTLWADARRGVTLPWTLALSVVLGVALMFTRVLFGAEGDMANSDHLVGALAITVATIATAEVVRAVRLLNIVMGAWLLAAPWLLEGATTLGAGFSVVAGLALIGLSLRRGRRSREHYAGWDRLVV